MFPFYHNSVINQVNALKPHTTMIFEKEDKTMLSSFKFAYFKKYEDSILTIKPERSIPVPSNWQILGYDAHQYTNVRYPFPFHPPYIEKDNPCGVYVTNYKVNSLSKNHYLNIDGADSCVYVYVNNEFVGYSTVSHCNAEFDISKYLHVGDNEVRLIVFKWCSMSYIEDQDKFRMSGLFRDVYIIRRNKDHLEDYTLTTTIDLANQTGELVFKTDKECSVTFEGITLKGKELVFKKEDVIFWSAETPTLYDLRIAYNDEVILEKVGFREVKVEGNLLLLNGQPIKFKGVNRHSSTVNGYVETIDDLKKDIAILKENNINAVRTSHYPPHKQFARLCDEAGIYVLEEADVEIHGVVFKDGVYSEKYYNDIANSTLYRDAICYRQEKMVQADKNRPSILIWSLGNEAGWGISFIDAAKVIKSIDNTRLVHYERTFLGGSTYDKRDEFNFASDCKESVDMYSRMYPSIEEMNNMKGKLDKPFILCEYSHAMGNSCGDLADYEKVIENEPSFCGGFIWELINHSIVENGKLLYGGDFKDDPNDNNFCMDGLVGIDREIFPEMLDVKEVFSYIKVNKLDEVTYEIKNNKYFTNLTDVKATIYYQRNGVNKEETLTIDLSDVKPQSAKVIKLNKVDFANDFITVNFIFTKEEHTISHAQFVLNTKVVEFKETNDLLKNSDGTYSINGFIINSNGMLEADCLNEPSFININRAHLDNDMQVKWRWNALKLETATYHIRDVKEEANTVTFIGSVNTVYNHIAEVAITYSAISSGIKVSMDVNVEESLPYLPRFGLSFNFKDSYNKATYLGYGPNEAYNDKHQAAMFKENTLDVFDKANCFTYPKPQESGSHYHTYKARLNDIVFEANQPFSFQAIPFKVEEFEDHQYKMNYDTHQSIVTIDYKMSGVGSSSCGPYLADVYQCNDKKFTFEFVIKKKD